MAKQVKKTTSPAVVLEVKESNEVTEQKKQVIAPAEVIEVKEKPVQKATKGRVLVQGAHAPVEVSPATAKIISKFKK